MARAILRLKRSSPRLNSRSASSFFGQGVDQVGGGGPLGAVDPHVERGVDLEGEAALRVIELGAGQAQIGQDHVDLVDAQVGQDLVDIGKVALDNVGPDWQGGEFLADGLEIGVVLVKADKATLPLEMLGEGEGMAGQAARAIDNGLAGLRTQVFQDLLEQDGQMFRRRYVVSHCGQKRLTALGFDRQTVSSRPGASAVHQGPVRPAKQSASSHDR